MARQLTPVFYALLLLAGGLVSATTQESAERFLFHVRDSGRMSCIDSKGNV